MKSDPQSRTTDHCKLTILWHTAFPSIKCFPHSKTPTFICQRLLTAPKDSFHIFKKIMTCIFMKKIQLTRYLKIIWQVNFKSLVQIFK